MDNCKINEIEKRYPKLILSISELIELYEKRYINNKTSCAENLEITENLNLPDDVVIPDDKYVGGLLCSLSKIKGVLGDWEYAKYEKGLNKLLIYGDFEDQEEIINEVHELIKKYIYGSDTKVSIENWYKLEDYIKNAGYVPISVKPGDDINKFKSFFDRPIQAKGGIPNTIKQIQLLPYIMKFYDGTQVQTVKLCGKCTYY